MLLMTSCTFLYHYSKMMKPHQHSARLQHRHFSSLSTSSFCFIVWNLSRFHKVPAFAFPGHALCLRSRHGTMPLRAVQVLAESTKRPDDDFHLHKGSLEFGTVDYINLTIRNEPYERVRAYLMGSPDRVVRATWDDELINQRSWNDFRLTTQPMTFVTVNIQPSIDVKVFYDEQEALIVESTDCSVNGLDKILGRKFADSLRVYVKGELKAIPESDRQVKLLGRVIFRTSGKLPLLFHLTPKPILQTASLAINHRVMSYAKGKFRDNLRADFDAWCKANPVEVSSVEEVLR